MVDESERRELLKELLTLRNGLDVMLGEVSENEYVQRLLVAVAEASRNLLLNPDLDDAIQQSLRIVGESADFDRVALLRRQRLPEDGPDAFYRHAVWSKTPVPDEVPPLVPADVNAEHWVRALERGETVRARAGEQPEVLWKILQSVGTGSVLFVPVPGEETYWGGLSFSSSDPARTWTRAEEAVLVTIAADIGGALARRNAAQRELDLQRQLLETRNGRCLSQLARGVAHDINNVLQVITGNVDLLKASSDLPQKLAPNVQQLLSAVERAGALVEKLRQYAGQSRPHLEEIDVAQLLDRVAPFARSALPETISFTLDAAENLPRVMGDMTQLEQVLMNLVMNARDALGPESGSVTMGARAAPAERAFVEITVTDTGPGLDEATRSRIFLPFFSTKGEGRGLGLAAVLGIVLSHGGTIDVESAPDEGTMFRIRLPAAERSP